MPEPVFKTLLLPFEQGALPMPRPRRAFLIRAEADPAISGPWRDLLACEQTFKPAFDRLEKAGFNAVTRLEGEFDAGLCRLTKHKLENLANIRRAWDLLASGGVLVCAGANEDGAASVERNVREAAGLAGQLSKYHCRAFWLFKAPAAPEPPAAWLEHGEARANESGYATRPGSFSHGKVDPGSRLLVAHAPETIGGDVADLGAGWGYIAGELLKRLPAIRRLDLYEAESLSLDAARLNVGGDSRAQFVWHDVASGLPARKLYDWIVMNPPFHTGRNTDVGLGRAFISAAATGLKPGGSLLLVANLRLPYEAALTERFASVRSLVDADGFKVLLASARRESQPSPAPAATPAPGPRTSAGRGR